MQTLQRSDTSRLQTERVYPPQPVRGLPVRTQIKVGPNLKYEACEICKNNCAGKPTVAKESCLADCEYSVCEP